MRSRARRPEEVLQRNVAEELRWRFRDVLWFHPPNGGKRSAAEAAIFKALGVLPGVPDLVFVLGDGRAAFIELKAGKGTLSEDQRKFRDHALARGCEWHVCRSVEEVMGIVSGWRDAGLLRMGPSFAPDGATAGRPRDEQERMATLLCSSSYGGQAESARITEGFDDEKGSSAHG